MIGSPILILYLVAQSQNYNKQQKYNKNEETKIKTRDPYAYFLKIQERCEGLKDYRCIFERKELVNGKVLKEQSYKVNFKTDPFSVYMENIKNPTGAKKILYIRDNLVVDDIEYMLVVPSGDIARFFFPINKIAIDGPEVLANSRNTIDCFGFANIINRIMKEVVSIDFIDYGWVASRQTRIYLCVLKSDIEIYIHIDKELDIPIAIRLFDKEKFLGYYNFLEVELNVGLQDSDFSL